MFSKLQSRLKSVLDDRWNQKQLQSVLLSQTKPPQINGRIEVVSFGKRGKLSLGSDVVLNSGIRANPVGGQCLVLAFIASDAEIHIGDRAALSNCHIAAAQKITIGSEAFLGAGCRIFDTDFHSIYPEYRLKGDCGIKCSPVTIGPRVLVGAFATILKSVSIGKESVIGACSVVTRNIPEREVWAGNPAKFICRIADCQRTDLPRFLMDHSS